MIKPINQAPPEFMTKFIDVLLGKEQLDTTQKIAAFWKFAVQVGWPHPEMRECIAELTIGITNRTDLESALLSENDPLHYAYSYLSAAQNMWRPDWNTEKHEETMEEFYDQTWKTLEFYIDKIE